MTLAIDRKELDEFCPRLFRSLDRLGLMPRRLQAKPNEFEKYPRLLIGSIQRYNDVEAGFKEWESRVLRGAPYRQEQHYPELEALRQWMVQHADVFTKKANMQHLRTSLYARIFQYMYPRLALMNAYCVKHRGNIQAISPEFIEKEFPSSVDVEVKKLQETHGHDWSCICDDARASLVANAAYYRKVLVGEEPAAPPEELELLGSEIMEPEEE